MPGLGLTQLDPVDNQPVRSDVQTFVIGGSNDPITPPSYNAAALETLTHANAVEYPRGGHGPSQTSPCLIQATAAFFNNPAVAPDTACVAHEAPLPFIVQ